MNKASINEEGNPSILFQIRKLLSDFLCDLEKMKGERDMVGAAYIAEVHLDDMGKFINNLYSEGNQVISLKIDMTGDHARNTGLAQVEVLLLS